MFTYGRRHLLRPRKSVRSPDSERFDNVRDDPIVYFRTRSRLNRAHKRTDIGFIGLPRTVRNSFRTYPRMRDFTVASFCVRATKQRIANKPVVEHIYRSATSNSIHYSTREQAKTASHGHGPLAILQVIRRFPCLATSRIGKATPPSQPPPPFAPPPHFPVPTQLCPPILPLALLDAAAPAQSVKRRPA